MSELSSELIERANLLRSQVAKHLLNGDDVDVLASAIVQDPNTTEGEVANALAAVAIPYAKAAAYGALLTATELRILRVLGDEEIAEEALTDAPGA